MSPAPVIIAIDGRSGAGKTTLAIELAARLREHHKVSLFHLEDIYPGWNGLAAGIERYASTVLAPLHRGETAEWVSWDWERALRRRHPHHPARRNRPGGRRRRRRGGRPPLPGRGDLGRFARTRPAQPGPWPGTATATHRTGTSGPPRKQEWLAADDVPAHADVRVLNLADGAAPAEVLQALQYLPALAPALLPELAARRGLQLRAERIDAAPDPARLFESLFGRSANAVWLDSSLPPDGSAAAERSRFSILADDGGPFGQSVRHSSGSTR